MPSDVYVLLSLGLSKEAIAPREQGAPRGREVDSDLAESIAALKSAFESRGLAPKLGKADPALVKSLHQKLRIPRRYREFLVECDPIAVQTTTPAERIRLVPALELEKEQIGFALDEAGAAIAAPRASGWRASWIIIAHSSLLGDPYFLDTADPDAEGDCPVYTAMSGTDSWQPRLCASSFALFLRILAIGMDVARGFDVDDYDVDNEQVFREAIGPKIREVDPAALKAGHWT